MSRTMQSGTRGFQQIRAAEQPGFSELFAEILGPEQLAVVFELGVQIYRHKRFHIHKPSHGHIAG